MLATILFAVASCPLLSGPLPWALIALPCNGALASQESEGSERQRAAVPSQEDLEAATAKLKEFFADDYSKTKNEDRLALSEKLWGSVDDLSDNPTDQYAALMEARRLWEFTCTPDKTKIAAKRLAQQWNVSELELRTQSIVEMFEKVRKSSSAEYLAEVTSVLEEALRADDWESVEGVLGATGGKVKRYMDSPQRLSVEIAGRSLEFWKAYTGAKEKLKNSPDDPASNLAVGIYLCFIKGKFESGMPYLSRCQKEALSNCAKQDVKQPTVPDQQVSLAGAWQDWARTQNEPVKSGGVQRALHWLNLALPSLTGIDRVNVEDQIAKLTEVAPPVISSSELEPAPVPVVRNRPKSVRAGNAVDLGVAWLVQHQDEDGHWDVAGFGKHCPQGEDACNGGGVERSVGVSGLALMALMAQKNSPACGDVQGAIDSGIEFLIEQQDGDTGLIGGNVGHAFHYHHAIATLALLRSNRLNPSAIQHEACQRAVNYILSARNPHGVWRYDFPPDGDADTSVTSWMVSVLAEARLQSFIVPEENFEAALEWVVKVTDAEKGRIGYDSPGSPSARMFGGNEEFLSDKGEAMTGAGLLIRFFCGQLPEKGGAIDLGIGLLTRTLPTWDVASETERYAVDSYYYYYGTEALWAFHGRRLKQWKLWNEALQMVLMQAQCKVGHAKGSWDPVDAWGYSGGRVYTTSMAILCLSREWR